jgi:hypothetical protein
MISASNVNQQKKKNYIKYLCSRPWYRNQVDGPVQLVRMSYSNRRSRYIAGLSSFWLRNNYQNRQNLRQAVTGIMIKVSDFWGQLSISKSPATLLVQLQTTNAFYCKMNCNSGTELVIRFILDIHGRLELMVCAFALASGCKDIDAQYPVRFWIAISSYFSYLTWFLAKAQELGSRWQIHLVYILPQFVREYWSS